MAEPKHLMVTEEPEYKSWRVKSVVDDDKVVLNPNSFCPMQKVVVEVSVPLVAQHDGHPWDYGWCEYHEHMLAEELAAEVRKHLRQALRVIDPYSGHR